MKLKQAMDFIKQRGITIENISCGYKITNAQGVTMDVTEKTLINYAKQIQRLEKTGRLY